MSMMSEKLRRRESVSVLRLEPPIKLNKRLTRIAVLSIIGISLLSGAIWRRQGGEFPSIASLLPGYYFAPVYDPLRTTSLFTPPNLPRPETRSPAELCATFPKDILTMVQPVLKMGHGEDRRKVEAQLESVSSCFGPTELLFYSDLDETILGRKAVDVLADLPPSYGSDNPDFDNYTWQKEMKENGTLDSDLEATARINGWIIDKYKFLPMMERVWATKPGRAFYFFYETDTYVFWDNAFRFLQTLDPDTPLYLGSPSPGQMDHDTLEGGTQTWFANGGPGFVLSRGAMKALLERRMDDVGRFIDRPLAEKWLPLLRGECCGDSVLGWALWNIGIPLQGYWPMFNPHPLHGVPFGERSWCQPTITLHKTKPGDMRKLWQWEFAKRKTERPLLYLDLWSFHHPGQPSIQDNWDNGAWDGWDAPPEADVRSFEACGRYCRAHADCVQWNWRGGDEKKCIAMRSFRYGEEWNMPESAGIGPGEVKSGWLHDRISRWRRSHHCEMVDWIEPSTTRIF